MHAPPPDTPRQGGGGPLARDLGGAAPGRQKCPDPLRSCPDSPHHPARPENCAPPDFTVGADSPKLGGQGRGAELSPAVGVRTWAASRPEHDTATRTWRAWVKRRLSNRICRNGHALPLARPVGATPPDQRRQSPSSAMRGRNNSMVASSLTRVPKPSPDSWATVQHALRSSLENSNGAHNWERREQTEIRHRFCRDIGVLIARQKSPLPARGGTSSGINPGLRRLPPYMATPEGVPRFRSGCALVETNWPACRRKQAGTFILATSTVWK